VRRQLAAPIAGQWIIVAPMHHARTTLSVVALNNFIYAIGGESDTGPRVATAERYDPATNTWIDIAPIPVGRSNAMAAALNGLIYVVGGADNGSSLNGSMYVYDPSSDTWTQKASLPITGACGVAGAIQGILYVTVGCETNGGSQSLLFSYDPATNSWTQLASPHAKHHGGAGAVINGKLYVAGGYNGAGLPNVLEIYDPASDSWTTGPDLPSTHADMGAAVVNGVLYVVGGGPAATRGTVDAFDSQTQAWLPGPFAPMSVPRYNHGAASVNGVIYAIGGQNGGSLGNILATTEAYVPGPVGCDAHEPNDTPQSTTPIDPSFGTTISDSKICTSTDVDYYTFQAPAGYRLFFEENPGASDPKADYQLILFRRQGDKLIPIDTANNPAGLPQVLAYQTTVAGTYYLRVASPTGHSSQSPYTLTSRPTFLSFPLPGGPSINTINSVFDHSGKDAYCADGRVVDYANDVGMSSAVALICGTDTMASTYAYSTSITIPNYHYCGTSPCTTALNYDGHPGYDLHTIGKGVGLDPSGQVNVLAAAPGELVYADVSKKIIKCAGAAIVPPKSAKFGTVIIDHHNGFLTHYLHLSSLQEGLGACAHIKRGDVIGKSGATGVCKENSPHPCGNEHLHFEVRFRPGYSLTKSAIPIDPFGWQPKVPNAPDPYLMSHKDAVNFPLW